VIGGGSIGGGFAGGARWTIVIRSGRWWLCRRHRGFLHFLQVLIS